MKLKVFEKNKRLTKKNRTKVPILKEGFKVSSYKRIKKFKQKVTKSLRLKISLPITSDVLISIKT